MPISIIHNTKIISINKGNYTITIFLLFLYKFIIRSTIINLK